MENKFEQYYVYKKENGIITDINPNAFNLVDEAFLLLKELYNYFYGDIIEHENLIEIHTGGWADNEELIREFKETGWWFMNHKITATGGHYYFNTDINTEKDLDIIIK